MIYVILILLLTYVVTVACAACMFRIYNRIPSIPDGEKMDDKEIYLLFIPGVNIVLTIAAMCFAFKHLAFAVLNESGWWEKIVNFVVKK